tara:strand:+ start:1251 stop:2003 length:753 start_codon:yes stop_codon:yes gene_type:complete
MIRGPAAVIRFALTILCLLLPSLSNADSLRIAVASNFAHTLNTLLPEFENDTGHDVDISSASSGKLYAQILHGAPFDVFLSADTDKPQRLAEQFPEIESTLFTYATGRLVYWCPNECEYPLSGISTKPDTLAIANPRLAPYGLAAKQTIEALKVSPPTLVTGENIGQAYRFIESGHAQAGFIALSQAVAARLPASQYWLVPDHHHAAIQQTGVLTPRGLNNPAAHAFIEYLRRPETQAQIAQQGYAPLYD